MMYSYANGGFGCRERAVDISFLKEFIVFAKHLNYARAAKELFVSQQSLRNHVKSLESEIGGPIVMKKGDSLHLTLAGRQLLKRSRSLVGMSDSMVQECRDLVSKSVSLSIGFLNCQWLEDLFLRARERYLRHNPGNSLELLFSPLMNANFESVSEGLVDIAIYPLIRDPNCASFVNGLESPEGIESMYMGASECRFWTTEGSKLYSLGSIVTEDARGMTLILGNTSNMNDAAPKYERYFSEHGVAVEIDNQPFQSYADYYLANAEDIFGIILEGDGYTNSPRDGIKVFSFEDMRVVADLYVIYDQSDFNDCAKGFVRELRDTVENMHRG